MSSSADLPIGLFDSGIGGLTVLRALAQRLPNESFLYLGDTARLPYGSKSPETIERYLHQNILFLQAQGVKAIVVACNTASTVLLGKNLQSAVPVYNVIEPGALAAARASQTQRIGVLGTRATVHAEAYVRALRMHLPNAHIVQQACPLLVPLVEEGWEDDPLTNLVIYRYVSALLRENIDTLILGCTHYPALIQAIRKVTGPGISLIDSAEVISQELLRDFQSVRLLANTGTPARIRLCATDVSPAFLEVANRLLHPMLAPSLECVDITP
jgi:glutamate racemase